MRRVLSVLALAACGPPPPSASAWAAAGGPAPGAAVAVGPDTAAALALPPPPPATPPPPRVAPIAPTAPAGDLYTYRGTFGARRAVARFTCAATCSGYYFFEDAGEAFRLRPSVPTVFEASAGAGEHPTVVGQLTVDAAPGKATLRGHFVAAGASGSGDRVTLARVLPGRHPAFVRRSLADRSPRDAECSVKVESFELLGARDPLLEWRINQALSPESLAGPHLADGPLADADDEKSEYDDSVRGAHIHCRMAMATSGGCSLDATAKVAMLDDRLVSVTLQADEAAGGAHPTFVVAGATVSLATGEVMGAGDLLADPGREPDWSKLVVPSGDLAKALASDKVDVSYGTGGPGSRSYAWSNWPWKSFYLTAAGVALPPTVDDAHKLLRTYVQTVPYAKLRGSLRKDGPAAYLWAGRR